MPLTNKAIALKKLKELRDIFKDNTNLIDITRYKNHKQVPFGFIVNLKNGLSYDYIQKLEKLGFKIVQIDTKIENQTTITCIQIYRHEIERESIDEFLFFGRKYIESFADWYDSSFYRKSKEIGTEDYWRVRYELIEDERKNEHKRYWEEQSKSSKLQKENTELKEQNYKLLTKMVNSHEGEKN